MSRWRVALRIAARDAWRHKVRSGLVILLVSLPVLVVTAGMVVERTANVTLAEGLPRTLGNADALVEPMTAGPLRQSPDAENWWSVDDTPSQAAPTESDLLSVLGVDSRVLMSRMTDVAVRDDDGKVEFATLREFPIGDVLTEPLLRPVSGALPATVDEVVVNDAFLAIGYEVGDRIDLGKGEGPTIVGIVEDASYLSSPVAIGKPGSLAPFHSQMTERWLVETGPVSWSNVEELNQLGFLVTSREVVLNPPAESPLDADAMGMPDGGYASEVVAVTALVVVMVLLQVALLAGPALAVTARQQSRTLALVAASGGTPSQARLVVIAQGLVLGVGAAIGGAVVGIPTGMALLAPAQKFNSWAWFGPLEIPWLWILVVVVLGSLAVLMASVVSAWLTARQDPVAALAGRRADGDADPRSPVVGLLLVGVGLLGTAYGATRGSMGETVIAAATVVVVLGVLLVIPIVLTALAKTVSGLPLPIRFAARDAVRHRGRTVPAVAAVAATVAGVVALGIGVTSQESMERDTYVPSLAMGASVVTWHDEMIVGEESIDPSLVGAEVLEVAERLDLDAWAVDGLVESYTDDRDVMWEVARVNGDEDNWLLNSSGSAYGSSILVSDEVPQFPIGAGPEAGVDPEAMAVAQSAIDAGRVLVFTSRPVDDTEVVVVRRVLTPVEGSDEWKSKRSKHVLPATFVEVGEHASMKAVVPPALAEAEGIEVETVGLLVPDSGDDAQQAAFETAVAKAVPDAYVYVERGFEPQAENNLVLLVLGVAGGVLMLVGTLTATFLALSDAAPDLATLGAVGAAPRTRRGVGAAYALLVAGVGAVLGALIGLVPGLASAYLMTTPNYFEGDVGPYFDVPWLLVLVVLVGLPLLTAAVIWVSARSRLPMVARVD